jgi:glycosyltransferase involved in cell wall biosynthesis
VRQRLIVVTDQLPHPPRNGITLPLANYLAHLQRSHELQLVLLRDADRPLDPVEQQDNVRRYGPILEATFVRKPRALRVADELRGRAMYQHGWRLADAGALADFATREPGWCTAPALVTPISAMARWQALRAALPMWQPRRKLVAVHDCTTAEYRFRWRSPQPGILGHIQAWSHWLRAPWVARAEQALLSEADRVLVQTDVDRQAMRRLVGEGVAARTVLAPNGVRTDLFEVDAVPPRAERILFVAELSGEYGPVTEWLCRAVWPRIRRERPAATLTIVGRGAPGALRQCLAATPGVEHIEFAADLKPLYARSDVVWSPLWKGFGLINKTLEAMAAARPVVGGAAAFNGIRGFVSGTHGVGLPKPDAAALADATVALLGDAARAHTMGVAARAQVRDAFRWESTVDRIREALADEPARAAAEPVTPGRAGAAAPGVPT